MHVSILTANTKLLAKRRKPSCRPRQPKHRIQRRLQDMIMFKGCTNASVLLNPAVRVSIVFSLVHFNPDQSLPPQIGLKKPSSFTLHILRSGLKEGHRHIYCCCCHFPHCLALPRKGKQKGNKRFPFLPQGLLLGNPFN